MPSYHSAHLLPVQDAPIVDRWVSPDGAVAFVHDLMAGPLPSEYDRCDVLYADLPWRAGFQVFNDRAGIHDGRTYPDFMAVVRRIIGQANRPTILVSGKHALSHLPTPAQTRPVQRPGTNQVALAIFYNLVTVDEWESHPLGLLERLARTYDCVGDFCCGYGNALRSFAGRGKRFVGSDYNPSCIGYIAAHASSWTKVHA